MAFLPFPKKMQIKIFQDNDNPQLGSFDLSEGLDLEHIRIMFIKHGNITPGATMRMSLGVNSFEASAHIYSDVVAVDDITDAEYWAGWVRFDFNGVRLPASSGQFVRIELTGYTEADDIYLGYAFDDTLAVNAFNASDNFGAAMQIIGNK